MRSATNAFIQIQLNSMQSNEAFHTWFKVPLTLSVKRSVIGSQRALSALANRAASNNLLLERQFYRRLFFIFKCRFKWQFNCFFFSEFSRIPRITLFSIPFRKNSNIFRINAYFKECKIMNWRKLKEFFFCGLNLFSAQKYNGFKYWYSIQYQKIPAFLI